MFFETCLIAGAVYCVNKLVESVKEAMEPPKSEKKAVCDSEDEIKSSSRNEVLVFEKEQAAYGKLVDRNIKLCFLFSGMAVTGKLVYYPLTILSALGMLYSAIPLFERGIRAVFKEKRPRIEILDTFAILFSVSLGYITAGAFMGIIYWYAQKLRIKTETSSRQNLMSIFEKQPDRVWILQEGVEIEIPFNSLEAGNISVINAGEPVPADGIVVHGEGVIDQHILTGESQPVEKSVGDTVFASTILLAGRIEVKVETAGDDTIAAKICGILRNTADFTAAIESTGQEIADASVVPSLVMSIGAFPFVGMEGMAALFSSNSLSSFRMAAPICILNYLNLASKNGILIKDGRSFQLLPTVDTVVFDKTGTLTKEQPSIGKIHCFNGAKEEEVLTLAAAAENRQAHPIAAAIIEAARERKLDIPYIDTASYEVGYGISVRIKERLIQVGSERFISQKGIPLPRGIEAIRDQSYELGVSLLYVSSDDALIGLIEMHPTIRPESIEVIRKLKERNIRIVIISGDHEKPTRAMAKKLGIDEFFAEILPRDKARLVEKLQDAGRKVCFVGDGINDSIALKTANVSVSLRGASTVATDSAQIVLMDESLEKLPQLFDIAYGFQNNMKDTFFAVSGPMIFCIGGVLYAHFTILSTVVLYGVSLASGSIVAARPFFNGKALLGFNKRKDP